MLRTHAAFALFVAVLGVADAPADVKPEVDMIIRYDFHDKPSDPGSDVVLSIVVTLQEFEQTGNKIGWSAALLEIRQPQKAGDDLIWSKTLPFVGTADGLWWITHADQANPVLEEFAVMPFMSGVAVSESNPTQKSMFFEMNGTPYAPPPGGPPYKPTFGMTYSFRLDGEDDPVAEGEEEPVEPSDVGVPA